VGVRSPAAHGSRNAFVDHGSRAPRWSHPRGERQTQQSVTISAPSRPGVSGRSGPAIRWPKPRNAG